MEEGTKPAYSLYSVQQVTGATFLGSPIAGAILMASNCRKLGKNEAATTSLLLGALATAALLAVAFLLPEKFPNYLLPVAYTVVIQLIAKSLQGPAYEEHIRLGGEKASAWGVVGLGLLCLGLLAGGIFGYAYLSEKRLGTRMAVGAHSEIYYAKGCTEGDAQALLRVLNGLKLLEGDKGTVTLAKTADGFAVSFVVRQGAWDDAEAVSAFRLVGQAISTGAFGGSPLEVRLCDEYYTTHKAIPIARAEPPAKEPAKTP